MIIICFLYIYIYIYNTLTSKLLSWVDFFFSMCVSVSVLLQLFSSSFFDNCVTFYTLFCIVIVGLVCYLLIDTFIFSERDCEREREREWENDDEEERLQSNKNICVINNRRERKKRWHSKRLIEWFIWLIENFQYKHP